MNTFMNGLKENANLDYTENGAVKRKSTNSKLLDMFALGGAYRQRSDEDCILLFKNALEENELYALKCLFYLRDVRGGQGERRFFRVCIKWLAKNYPQIVERNLKNVVEMGRWDDLYTFVETPVEKQSMEFIKKQLELDVQCKTPSLLAKWLKSENASSENTKYLGNITRKYLKMSHKQYRKTLSILRARINVLERLMSENRWDEIEFDKIPSRAGIIYRNAFARHDLQRAMTKGVQTYADFAKDVNSTVNAKTLYPYECVAKAFRLRYDSDLENTERLMINKYWDNLEDYFKEASFNGMAVVDVSGSMFGCSESAPINVSIALGMYCAEKSKGPFANHFITFSSKPRFVEIEGVDFCDKVKRMLSADWGMSTNIEAAFDLMLNTAIKHNCSQEEIPENLIIISDMEFDDCAICGESSKEDDRYSWYSSHRKTPDKTLFETMKSRWESHGYKMPKLIFWNVNARSNNIPMRDDGNVNYVSGMSPVIFEQIMKGLSAYDLMMDKLNSDRYSSVK